MTTDDSEPLRLRRIERNLIVQRRLIENLLGKVDRLLAASTTKQEERSLFAEPDVLSMVGGTCLTCANWDRGTCGKDGLFTEPDLALECWERKTDAA